MRYWVQLRGWFIIFIGLFLLSSGSVYADSVKITLVQDGKANATIVIAESPTLAANLAAIELQYHIEKITDVVLPIQSDLREVQGNRILVGDTKATKKIGLQAKDLESQEYLIRFFPETIVLLGRDWQGTPEELAENGIFTSFEELKKSRTIINYQEAVEQVGDTSNYPKQLTLPGRFDDQGTCYATYDFLERFCDVRWYGPSVLNVVFPRRSTLTVAGRDIRRSPALKSRDGLGGSWPIIKAQWNNPNPSAVDLYWRRIRSGGEKWAANHSMISYPDRFQKENCTNMELYEREEPGFFAKGRTCGGGNRQFCYTNPELIKQVVQDARDYFDGKGLKGRQDALGDYFAIVPNDNAAWCLCENCQALLAMDKDNHCKEHFSGGQASHYLFSFINAVAREVRKTHPDKYISALAYHVYAYRPKDIDLESNIAVAPCLQPRNYWAPKIRENDIRFYEEWVSKKDRPIYLWNYYCFPEEVALGGKFNCFPGFSAHVCAEQIKMYHSDGVRGVFLCGIGEQVDYYLTMKMYDDPNINPDELLNEFFSRYFGVASEIRPKNLRGNISAQSRGWRNWKF
ncbi:MAG: DUF4838 domain-containing protein [Planctomycetota bacterium]|nr:DUF4838 domain-containing protein [Planctomycetota bacterium]